jgi:hypothetical protein
MKVVQEGKKVELRLSWLGGNDDDETATRFAWSDEKKMRRLSVRKGMVTCRSAKTLSRKILVVQAPAAEFEES